MKSVSHHSRVFFQANIVKSCDDYRLFFIQRDLLCLLDQVSRRCLHLLATDDSIEPNTVPSLIDTIGAIVKLLVILDQPDNPSILTKEHHYPVKTDLSQADILERCIQVLSDLVLEESDERKAIGVKHFQSIINRLFAAATDVTRHIDSTQSDFEVDVIEQSLSVTSSEQYDADDSASASNDENANDGRNTNETTYAQSTVIVSEKIIEQVVLLIVGLGQKEFNNGREHYGRAVEYGLAKLVTLCGNSDNLKLLVDMNLCSKLLSGLGHILCKTSNIETSGGTLPLKLLELVTILSSHKMSREDFRAMIGFFKTAPSLPETSVALVLENLHRIVLATSCPATDQPSAFLTFPTGAN